MRLQVKRLDNDGRYETVITRDDGVSFRVLGVAHTFAIPHDLAHYVVEKTLMIEDGFWGSIAAGAVFPTMTYLAGRRKPRAAERSSALLKANARALADAEILVCIFNGTIEQVIVRTRRSLPVGYNKTACLTLETNYGQSARMTLLRCTLLTRCCDKTGRRCRSQELSFGNGDSCRSTPLVHAFQPERAIYASDVPVGFIMLFDPKVSGAISRNAIDQDHSHRRPCQPVHQLDDGCAGGWDATKNW
jgi:hypothetical protein